MYIAYMDDAGDLGAVANPPQHNDQPVFALTLLFVNQTRLAALVPEFLQAKRNFLPGTHPSGYPLFGGGTQRSKGSGYSPRYRNRFKEPSQARHQISFRSRRSLLTS